MKPYRTKELERAIRKTLDLRTEDLVSEWHKGKSLLTLTEFLYDRIGMTKEEYADWVERTGKATNGTNL